MRKKKFVSGPGLPCIHVRIPKKGKDIRAEIIEPSTNKVLWKKTYPKGTDVESIMAEARLFKPKSKIQDVQFNPVRFPVSPQKMVA